MRVPTRGPRPALRKSQGRASPPEPDIWLMTITLGPKMACAGSTTSAPSRLAFAICGVRSRFSMM